MADISNEQERHDIWQTVQALNRAWTTGKCAELKEYFHRDMVAVTPVDRLRREGQQACIDGWAGFVAATTKIHFWKEIDPKIQVYGDSAVVTYYFDMSYEMGGQTIISKGRDMFFMVRENDRWWAVANQFSMYPK
jgi:ketosteroid isomerase-like protein